MKLKMYRFYTLNENEAVTPKDGQCVVNRYWLVNESGLMLYYAGELIPQNNKDENIANYINSQSNALSRGECKVKLIPVVYLGRQNTLERSAMLVGLKA
jgi:hypothetical protein